MAPQTFPITYAAHTAGCTFLLDEEGTCRRVLVHPKHPKSKRGETARAAARCIGAQYVASLDAAAAGCLVERPRVGSSMLFAHVDARGRVSLVRTGPVTRFDSHGVSEAFDDASVKTSAPDLSARRTSSARSSRPVPAPPARAARSVPDYSDPSERTMRNESPGSEAADDQEAETADPASAADSLYSLDSGELATAEYRSAPSDTAPHRMTFPRELARAPTLHERPLAFPDEGGDAYAHAAPAQAARGRRDR